MKPKNVLEVKHGQNVGYVRYMNIFNRFYHKFIQRPVVAVYCLVGLVLIVVPCYVLYIATAFADRRKR